MVKLKLVKYQNYKRAKVLIDLKHHYFSYSLVQDVMKQQETHKKFQCDGRYGPSDFSLCKRVNLHVFL